jgi:ubiquinone/menaquinone biosynthesis C-methylase UbiE
MVDISVEKLMNQPNHNDYITYPESSLRDRIKLAHDWIPAGARRILDGGCAFGYGTRHFQKGNAKVWGVDPNAEFIAVAQKRYPDINFEICGVEQTPFSAEFFDVVILNDVLEHVIDECKTLNEMFRVLSPGGSFIITTPHRGLFAFMDPDNYTYHLRTKTPGLYRFLFRAKYGRLPPTDIKPGYEQLHRHYAVNDFKQLLDKSDFKGRYAIETKFRGGLFIGVFTSNLFEFLSIFTGVKIASKLTSPLGWLAELDYFISYGFLAYNIGILIKKLKR